MGYRGAVGCMWIMASAAVESQNVERDIKVDPVPNPATQSPIQLALNISRDEMLGFPDVSPIWVYA